MSRLVDIILRGLVLLWTLLITALIGNVIASNINGSSSASRALNYTMFTAAWCWIAGLIGLAAVFIAFVARPIIMIPLDLLAVLFTFVAGILLAVKIRAVDCGDLNILRLPRDWIAFGSNNTEKRCREIQASVVFIWFLWACLVPCLVFSFLNSRGSLRFSKSSRPNMAQV